MLVSAITSELLRLDAIEPQDVPLDPEVTDIAVGRGTVRVRPTGRVRCGRTDVGTHQLRNDQHRSATLDRLAFESVVAVARPHANGAAQDLVIDPCPARRATLDLDIGMGGAELVEQPIHRQCLGVGAGRTVGPESWMWSRFMSHLTNAMS